MPDITQHCRNVEIKAKIADEEEFNKKINIAKQLTGKQEATVIVQHDVFFKVPNGRLKLRYEVWLLICLFYKFKLFLISQVGSSSKLVQYSRANVTGPKLSNFNVAEIPNGKLFEQMLDESIGTLGVLDKTRYLFIHEGRTRIHLDVVKNKGENYYGLEFEVVLQPDEEIELGNQISKDLIELFELKPEQLLEGSYFEILNADMN